MVRPRIDMSRFLDAAPEAAETPQERRARITNAVENVDAMKGAIIENRRENERLVHIHRKAKSNLFLDMRDLMAGIGPIPSASEALLPEDRMGMSMPTHHEFLTEQFPTHQDNMIMEQMYAQPRQPQRQPQRQSLLEQIPVRKPAPKLDLTGSAANWTIKKYLGETRGGDTIPVWKVQNKKAGSSLDKLFRIEGVANRIAMILNESNDLNDHRVVGLIALYDKRDKLLKESRQLEKSADGKPMKTERLRAIRAEINQLDYRLGI